MECLEKCKKRNAPGADTVSYEFFKMLPQNWCLYIAQLFNKILKSKKVLTLWRQVIAFMIYKKGDKTVPDNYICIALMNSVDKILTEILNDRLKKWANITNIIPESYSGFRGCLDNIFIINSIIQIKLRRPGGKLYEAFVDFRRAFPSVNHNKL